MPSGEDALDDGRKPQIHEAKHDRHDGNKAQNRKRRFARFYISVGHVTLRSSPRESSIYCARREMGLGSIDRSWSRLARISLPWCFPQDKKWQGRRDSNPQLAVWRPPLWPLELLPLRTVREECSPCGSIVTCSFSVTCASCPRDNIFSFPNARWCSSCSSGCCSYDACTQCRQG